MAAPSILTQDTFRFFRELSRNNRKEWMDANRDRYQSAVVAPLHALLDALAPAVRKLSADFDTSGRTGPNFSRINRDIRFARDKTPYRAQMYVKFPSTRKEESSGGELYVGVSPDAVTCGFRIYGDGRDSILSRVAAPRALANGGWLARQKKRLGARYDSYWYSAPKGEWTKHDGWPLTPDDWRRIKGWIVRRKLTPGAALRAGFLAEVIKNFRELFPLFAFTTAQRWRH